MDDSTGQRSDDQSNQTLKYHLLGSSLTKAGQDTVDQSKVSEVIYHASKGSKYFTREEVRDKALTEKIVQIQARKLQLEKQDMTQDLRRADRLIADLEASRDLTQHIVHIDCDAFYAAVEQLERPELKNLPFAVGSGVLTTCNYIARKFGCRSGMAGFVAKQLCPNIILIKPNFQKYIAKAHEVREIFAQYDAQFESASIDEAYLNITDYCLESQVCPPDAISQMRREISLRTGITVSAGIAANTRLAKICSNLNKPDGQFILPNERNSIITFMRTLQTRKVNGIGRVLERELGAIGVRTCGDIYEVRQYLSQLFGTKTFAFLINCHLGLGRTKTQRAEDYERKSIGTESTFSEISDARKLRSQLRFTAEELEKDMKRVECKGRTLCLKVKLHTFEIFTRQVVMPKAINAADDLYNLSLPMLARLEQEIPGLRLRLMGLRCTHLVSTVKPDALSFLGFKRWNTTSAESSGVADQISEASQSIAVNDEMDCWHSNDDDSPDDQTTLIRKTMQQAKFDAAELYPWVSDTKESDVYTGESEAEVHWWDCPICLRPQVTNERLFNAHVDLCLSRQEIRNVVQNNELESNTTRGIGKIHTPRRTQSTGKRKGRAHSSDPRQKKLAFG